jgi:hypothetical protein
MADHTLASAVQPSARDAGMEVRREAAGPAARRMRNGTRAAQRERPGAAASCPGRGGLAGPDGDPLWTGRIFIGAAADDTQGELEGIAQLPRPCPRERRGRPLPVGKATEISGTVADTGTAVAATGEEE